MNVVLYMPAIRMHTMVGVRLGLSCTTSLLGSKPVVTVAEHFVSKTEITGSVPSSAQINQWCYWAIFVGGLVMTVAEHFVCKTEITSSIPALPKSTNGVVRQFLLVVWNRRVETLYNMVIDQHVRSVPSK